MVQLLYPQFRMFLLSINELERSFSKSLKVPRIGLCNLVELESVQAFGSFEVGGIAEGVGVACFLCEFEISLHHLTEDAFAEVSAFDGYAPDVHEGVSFAQERLQFWRCCCYKVLFQLDYRGHEVQIFHVNLVKTGRSEVEVLSHAYPNQLIVSLGVEASHRDRVVGKILGKHMPKISPFLYSLMMF